MSNISVTWDNSLASGDNNPNIASVTFDFTEFGGPVATAGTNNSDIWSATFLIVDGSIMSNNLNVFVTATNNAPHSTTTQSVSDDIVAY